MYMYVYVYCNFVNVRVLYWGEPEHTNRYYEKIGIVMYVHMCVCVRNTSTTYFACTHIKRFYIIYIHYVDHVF